MKLFFITAVFLFVSACSHTPEPQVVMVEADPRNEGYPAECTSKDPSWSKLPDTDIDKMTIPRNDRKNETNFKELLGKRAICRADILARQKKG